MNTQTNLKPDIRSMQEKAEDTAKNVQAMSRKTMLTYLGLMGLAYDAGNSLLEDARQLLARAETRGAVVEERLTRYLRGLQDSASSQVRDVRVEVEQRVEQISQDLTETGKSVEQSVKQAVEQATPGKTNGPIPDLGEMLPFSDYDDMKVQDVISGLTSLSEEQLSRLREYEVSHKNRSSVLRELDARLQPPAEGKVTISS